MYLSVTRRFLRGEHIDFKSNIVQHYVWVSKTEKWIITSSSLYPMSVLTGSHIDFVSLRVLALPGLYLRDKSNCLSLDRLLPLLPSVSLCAKICQVKSLHTLKSRFTTCRSAEHYRWLTYQQTLPHGMLQTWQHNTLAKIYTNWHTM